VQLCEIKELHSTSQRNNLVLFLLYFLYLALKTSIKSSELIMFEVEDKISKDIIGKAIEVHKALGPGLLESTYQECLYYELKVLGYHVDKELALPIIYKDIKLDHGYRIDLLVENKVVIEIKTVETFTDVHFAQVLTYMKLGGFKLGLLINFNVSLLKQGIRRFVM
jgi:GxxExxY protein